MPEITYALDTLMAKYYAHRDHTQPLRCTRGEHLVAIKAIVERHGYVLRDEQRRVLFLNVPLEVTA